MIFVKTLDSIRLGTSSAVSGRLLLEAVRKGVSKESEGINLMPINSALTSETSCTH